jgi:peptide/nickel transport system ATP-binding protein
VTALGVDPETERPQATARLQVEGLRVERGADDETRTIVHGMQLTVAPREAIAIVGESGSGKSLTARSIVGLLPDGISAHGSVRYEGVELLDDRQRDVRQLRGSNLALLMQDPFTMLSPVRRCADQLIDSLRLHAPHRSRRELEDEVTRRLAEVEIADPSIAHRYPFELSGGMRQRVAMAAALARDPDVLIADEPTTALDVTTQKRILHLLRDLQRSRGMSLVLITHDLRVAFAVCDRIYVMYAGTLVEVGPAAAVNEGPLHPYTAGLLSAEPSLTTRRAALAVLEGEPVAAHDVGDACAFAGRCGYVQDACLAERPPLAEQAPGRASACIRAAELRGELAARPDGEPAVVGSGAEQAGALLTVSGLTKAFRHGPSELTAVDDVALELRAGECVGLIGESGSGKSTIGRCLVGLETPTSGTIDIGGRDASDYDRLAREQRNELRRTIQMVFQDPYSSLNASLTVGATIREPMRLRGLAKADQEAEVDRLLSAVGLSPRYAGKKPRNLSGGERQRVSLARALAAGPEILVCDECVSALDVAVQGQVLELLRSLQRELGMTYLFITHDLAVARQVADRLYVLEHGRVVESGPVDEVLDHPTHPYTQRLVASVPRSNPTWLSNA